MKDPNTRYRILEDITQGKTYTMQEALKTIAENWCIFDPEDGFLEAEEQDSGIFKVCPATAFYLLKEA